MRLRLSQWPDHDVEFLYNAKNEQIPHYYGTLSRLFHLVEKVFVKEPDGFAQEICSDNREYAVISRTCEKGTEAALVLLVTKGLVDEKSERG